MTSSEFDRYIIKLSKNVYGSTKGKIRLTLLERDLREFCRSFNAGGLHILDAGCGEGFFAARCLEIGHRLSLLDSNWQMIETCRDNLAPYLHTGQAEAICADFLNWHHTHDTLFDMVLLHGSAEWMSNAGAAMERACDSLRDGGYLSLLMYNRDMHIYKKGINGHSDGNDPNRKPKLFPHGAQRLVETVSILNRLPGKILLQSGIRIFYGVFRELTLPDVADVEWLQQEQQYYREHPFSSLGQHTHFIWQKTKQNG